MVIAMVIPIVIVIVIATVPPNRFMCVSCVEKSDKVQ